MSYINQASFEPAGSIKVLTLEEVDAVAGANRVHDAANVAMATGAAIAGLGVVYGVPQGVAAGTIIAGAGGVLYLGASVYDWYTGS